jgi:hypothetical protein
MTLRPGSEDFVANTLEKIPGIWARLLYLAKLRSPGRGIPHWGLEQTYGREAAQEIIASVHGSLFNSVLAARLQSLETELPPTVQRQQRREYFRKVADLAPALAPDNASAAALLHFDLVLDYLVSLAEADSTAA